MRIACMVVVACTFVACSYRADFDDCRVACGAASGCPSGLTCATSEGWCRTGETAALCAATDGDAGPCLTYFDDETAFMTATSTLTLNVEDFSRTAAGSPTPNAFVIQNGDYFYWHSRVAFETHGVNTMPGGEASTVAVGGAAAPAATTIMSQLSSSTAHDAIAASFSTAVGAVAIRPSDDEGTQGYAFEVVTTSGTMMFPVASAHAPFVGIVDSCGSGIISATLSPPMPSHWWRLFRVTFGP